METTMKTKVTFHQLAPAKLPNDQKVMLRSSSSVEIYVKKPVTDPDSAEIATAVSSRIRMCVFPLEVAMLQTKTIVRLAPINAIRLSKAERKKGGRKRMLVD